MATIQDAIAQNIAKVGELKPLIEAERAQVLAAIAAAASAQQARIDELTAQLAAGAVVTPEQLAALAAPFAELGVAIQNIQEPGAPVSNPAPEPVPAPDPVPASDPVPAIEPVPVIEPAPAPIPLQ